MWWIAKIDIKLYIVFGVNLLFYGIKLLVFVFEMLIIVNISLFF